MYISAVTILCLLGGAGQVISYPHNNKGILERRNADRLDLGTDRMYYDASQYRKRFDLFAWFRKKPKNSGTKDDKSDAQRGAKINISGLQLVPGPFADQPGQRAKKREYIIHKKRSKNTITLEKRLDIIDWVRAKIMPGRYGAKKTATGSFSPRITMTNTASSTVKAAQRAVTNIQLSTKNAGGSSNSAPAGAGASATQNKGVFGVDCDKFYSAVTAGGYKKPTSAQCDAFLKGIQKGGISSAREVAMFLTHIMIESVGLSAKSEHRCESTDCKKFYSTPNDLPGKVYFGRGYIQLTWEYNYRQASMDLYGDDRLSKNPETVATNEQVAWDVSFWFWKNIVRVDPGVQAGKFGASTNKINGALECRGEHTDKAKKRFQLYTKMLAIIDPSSKADEHGCYN
ncbi:Acidic endochitinase SP2 [Zancudomyces culisetae]|uniref:Acidic endochitinase SP2 n=1 Tax=Zancudomyces culisetae TaxID=1213189 RepID=A0A1R1PPB6_ZANCU|nr:Acidic endochitinase SP2 [Zancudomyces culisetae]|eukprot:OMH82722.1 Acidic endochitinase SP2 [Zancudomyces culisetae]